MNNINLEPCVCVFEEEAWKQKPGIRRATVHHDGPPLCAMVSLWTQQHALTSQALNEPESTCGVLMSLVAGLLFKGIK